MKIDPKVKNLLIFVAKWLGGISFVLTAYVKITGESNPLVIVGHFTSLILVWRILLFLTRRYLLQTPPISSRGKWCIVVDNGSSVGAQFVNYLVARKMPIYIVSTESTTHEGSTSTSKYSKLVERLSTEFHTNVEIKQHVFGQGNDTNFYETFTKRCQQLDNDGGIGLLVCNFDVDRMHSTPVLHEDLPIDELDSILARTVYPFAHVVSTVHGFMVKRRSGAVITMSSALGNHSSPYMSLYSATKSFMTQLTRSLHIESWGTGVAFLAVTPFDNFGPLTATNEETLVHTVITQVGKQYFWQICGTYASIALDWAVGYNPFAFNLVRRYMYMLKKKSSGSGAGHQSSPLITHASLVATCLIAPVSSFSLALVLSNSLFRIVYSTTILKKIFLVIGLTAFLLAFWRVSLSLYRRLLTRPRSPASCGKWAIVTGSTSGIGKDYAAYLAKSGVSVLIISRSESKLIEQKNELLSSNPGKISVEYIAFDFNQVGSVRDTFYEQLNSTCARLNLDGGIGLLVNNVGVANEYPMKLEEFSFAEIDDMLTCNISSIVLMSRSIIKLMKVRGKGSVLNVSSGSGNHCGPLLALYSSTK